MKLFAVLPLLLLVGCTAPAARFTYTDPNTGARLEVLMEKEVEATNLLITLDPDTGIATFYADKWESKSSEVIKAQAKRDAIAVKAVEKISEGATRGAMKGLVPIP